MIDIETIENLLNELTIENKTVIKNIDTIARLCEVYCGLSDSYKPTVVLVRNRPFNLKKEITIGSFRIEERQTKDLYLLYIICSKNDSIPLFARFSFSLIQKLIKINGEESLVDVIYQECRVWKEVFDIESRSEIIGLIGELLVYKMFCEKGINILWQYPNKTIKDFNYGNKFFEVKTTTKRIGKIVNIHGFLQLDYSPLQELYLVFVRLEPVLDLGEVSINKLVEQIGKNCLSEKQLSAINAISQKDREISFNCINEIELFQVDESFPRLIPKVKDLISNGQNILDVHYSIDLTNLEFQSLNNYLAKKEN